MHRTEEYGYALPLGRGIERCPMPQFDLPPAHDVSSISAPYTGSKLTHQARNLTAYRFPPTPHGRRFRSFVPNQDQPRYDYPRVQVPGRYHRRSRFKGDCRVLHWYVRRLFSPLLLYADSGLSLLFASTSFRNGQEGYRDQPLPVRNHGRRCWYVPKRLPRLVPFEIRARS